MILLLAGGLGVVLLREAACGARCAGGTPVWLVLAAGVLLAPGAFAALAAWVPLLGETRARGRWAWFAGLALWLPCVVLAVVGGAQADLTALPAPAEGAAALEALGALRRWSWVGLALAPLGSLHYSRRMLRRGRLSVSGQGRSGFPPARLTHEALAMLAAARRWRARSAPAPGRDPAAPARRRAAARRSGPSRQRE